MAQSGVSLTPNQVSVGSTATLLSAQGTAKVSVLIENHGTTEVFVGGLSVTSSTGFKIPGVAGATLTLDTSGAVYGITASGSQTVSVMEISR